MSDEPLDEIGGENLAEPEPASHVGDFRPPIASEIPFGLVVFLIISLLVVVFTVQNTQNVNLKFLAWEGRFPLALIIIGVVTVTVILDEVFGLVLRRRRRIRVAEKEELRHLREQNL